MQSTIAEIIRNLPIFVGAIAALLITLVVVVSKMPDTNPLKRILTALCSARGNIGSWSCRYPVRTHTRIDVLYDIRFQRCSSS
jgi:predicted permease